MCRFEFILIVLNVFLFSANSFETTGEIPCQDDTDCKNFDNATCAKPFCLCNGTKQCTETVDVVVGKIGEHCTKSQECNIENAECLNNTCICQKGYVKATNGRNCLLISEGVGGSCEDSIQCYTKTNFSVCRNNKCVCDGMHEVNGTCFKNVELGGTCQENAECSLNKFAKCQNSTCTCKDGFVSGLNNTACFMASDGNNSPCVDNLQCTVTLGDYSHCIDSICICKELYHYKDRINKCIQDRLFGDTCAIHSDCHDVDPKKESRLECIYGECKCRSFYTEKNGICVDTSGISKISASCYLLFLLYIFINILHFDF